MLSFKKVVKSTSKKENPDKKDQKNYMDKVKVLSNSCISFVKYLKKINENTDLSEMEKAFRTSFRVPMSKNKMLSRTSKKLHEMDKKLLKLKGKFKFEDVEEYGRVFVFEAKKADKNDYIKRSAIDDETIANTFNSEIPRILKGRKQEIVNGKTRIFTAKTEEDLKKVEDYKNNITSIFVGGKIEKIGNEAFSGFSKLQTVQLGKNCKKIGNNAFLNCSALSKINLENVTAIGDYAFSGCKNISSDIDLKKAKTIGTSVFSQCALLKKVDLGDATTISPYAFAGCKSLKTINLGNVTTIGDNAFLNCSALSKINLENVTSIGCGAFLGCAALSEIDLRNVTKIEESAFSKCIELKGTKADILNTEKLTTIGRSAFIGCEKLIGVNLRRVTTVGKEAFEDCSNLKSVDLLTNSKAEKIKGIIQDQTGNKNIEFNVTKESSEEKPKEILSGVYYVETEEDLKKAVDYKDSITDVIVRSSKIKEISERTFANFNKLRTVTLHGNCKKIGDRAFYNCKGLELINLGTITTIGDNAFLDCESLKRVDLKNVTSIGNSAFSGCKNISSDIDLKKVKTIGTSVFSQCALLKKVDFGDDVATISPYAFSDCKLLETIHFGKAKTIGINAFLRCTALSEINLENVTEIEGYAFNSCGSLKKIVLGQSQVNVAYDSFPDTKDLTIFVSDNTSALAEKINKLFTNIIVTVKDRAGEEVELKR